MAKIIAGSSNRKLSKELAGILDLEYIEARIDYFADRELRVQLYSNLLNEYAIIVQSTSTPVNDNIMEFCLLADTAKHACAKKVIAVIPYFGYSRQDRLSYNYGPISCKLVATLMESSGMIDAFITIDLHSPQSEGFFSVPIHNLSMTGLFSDLIKQQNGNLQDIVIVSPDIGGFVRAREMGNALNTEVAVINKSRKTYNECEMHEIIGDIKGKHCIILDDIIDTGNTLCKAAELLMQRGAKSVEAFVTHAVLSSDGAIKNIEASKLENITITNTIQQTKLPKKFSILDITPILAENLRKMIKNL